MSSFFLKVFALVFMIIDHTGFVLFPGNLFFRAIGRLAFPLFAYQMAVGFSHTRNKEKHIWKLLIFGFICQIPYVYMLNLYNLDITPNILFTFVIALLMIYATEHFKFWNKNVDTNKINFDIKKSVLTLVVNVVLLILGIYLKVDYGWYGILLTFAFYFTLNKKVLSMLFLFILVNLNFIINPTNLSMLAYISLFDILFILFFNGKQGYKNSWIFYALYFLHFFPLFFIEALR